MVLLDSLFLEGQALVLKGLLSLKVDFALSKFVHGSVILLLDILNLGGKGALCINVIRSKFL